MKSGSIEQFAHLSEFNSVKEFNQSISQALEYFCERFTKGERIAFEKLIQYSVKKYGVCNARISKLVQASHSEKGGISRSTFERMLRKAKAFGIFTIHHTIREKGGYSHNVYIFHRFDGANQDQLTERKPPQKQDQTTAQPSKKAAEARLLKTKKPKQDLRPPTIEALDASFVPAYVPASFVESKRNLQAMGPCHHRPQLNEI
ncbi:hypothetical protein [Halalkalibacterium ligniniphilum]|uniref:hypothetical protein n=1 Tax=Halalkalibacterium ligniniphilum TaxID=1134413 RepID=UPI000344FCEA|nr:hypothetical protein [Halalkalibacterium ligniniphilum]